MKLLDIKIEINGNMVKVGELLGNSYLDAQFKYDDSYLDDTKNRPISISLPLKRELFSSIETHNFFDGLLPEGFTRINYTNTANLHIEDYVSILKLIGSECIGALSISSNDESMDSYYKKISDDEFNKLSKEGVFASNDFNNISHLSLAGASGKVGLYFDNYDWYLPIGNMPSTHIVKQSHVRFNDIVFNELLCTKTAKNLGINTIESNFI